MEDGGNMLARLHTYIDLGYIYEKRIQPHTKEYIHAYQR